MALKNGALSAAAKAKGDKITTSIYDDLSKLLANDNGLDADISSVLSKQPTVINCMNGCALGCSSVGAAVHVETPVLILVVMDVRTPAQRGVAAAGKHVPVHVK